MDAILLVILVLNETSVLFFNVRGALPPPLLSTYEKGRIMLYYIILTWSLYLCVLRHWFQHDHGKSSFTSFKSKEPHSLASSCLFLILLFFMGGGGLLLSPKTSVDKNAVRTSTHA